MSRWNVLLTFLMCNLSKMNNSQSDLRKNSLKSFEPDPRKGCLRKCVLPLAKHAEISLHHDIYTVEFGVGGEFVNVGDSLSLFDLPFDR